MEILNSEQIEKVKWALNNINFDHWKKYWQYGYNYLNKYEIPNKAGSILYEYNIYRLNADFTFQIEKYLNQCEKINQLLEFVYQNNLNIKQVEAIFDETIEYLQGKIDRERIKYEQEIKDLENKKLNEYR